ncbi:MAG: hypothetical protein KDD69_08100 [Bdellovibrionales bacterium]|nr:hypothetical protein [Bdellovibrionales bacterium]
MKKPKVALLPNHPSQIWVLRPVVDELSQEIEVLWVLRDKDVSVALAERLGLDFITVSKAKTGYVGNGGELLINIFRCLGITKRHGIDLWVTKYGCGNMAALLAGKQSVSFNDDDVDNVPLIAWTSYPFAERTLVPDFVRMGRFEKRAVRYPSCHELFYLHPNRFTPDPSIRRRLGLAPDEAYAVVRLSALQAHHDVGMRGVGEELLRQLIRLVEGKVRLFITSEKPLSGEFESLRCPLPPDEIHHALAFAEFLFGDSQTMTSEAAVLGTPAYRISDFVGKVTAIALLEQYGLSHGYLPDDAQKALEHLEHYLAQPNRKAQYEERRRKMLSERSDPVPLFAATLRELLKLPFPERAVGEARPAVRSG